MIKLAFCLHRQPHLTREAFQSYWHDRHAPLVARHAQVLGIVRYIQNHGSDEQLASALAQSRGSSGLAFDGIAELWWESLDALTNARDPDAARGAGRELLDDERRFIDLPRSPIFFVEERRIISDGRPVEQAL
ncbi:MAG: EthD domain-containing protein [Caulobacterales bacterium]